MLHLIYLGDYVFAPLMPHHRSNSLPEFLIFRNTNPQTTNYIPPFKFPHRNDADTSYVEFVQEAGPSVNWHNEPPRHRTVAGELSSVLITSLPIQQKIDSTVEQLKTPDIKMRTR